jgi:hypothetical protein
MRSTWAEFRSLLPTLAVTLLFPLPLLNFVHDGTGRAFAFAYLFFGCALLAAECFRPISNHARQEPTSAPGEDHSLWQAKMAGLVVASALAAGSFSVCYWAISGELTLRAVVLAFIVIVPALAIVPCLTLTLRNPYIAVVFAALLLGVVKLAGCVLVRVVYGPTAQAEGYMAMSWDRPNLLVWFCLVGALMCSVVFGIIGFRMFSRHPRTYSA